VTISVINNPRGPNYKQLWQFKEFCKDKFVTCLNHGGDKQDKVIHDIAIQFSITTNIYPLVGSTHTFPNSVIYNPTSVSIRNRTLVDKADIIVAIPMIVFEYEDSATWRTINYAISKNKPVTIFSPKGNTYTVTQYRMEQ